MMKKHFILIYIAASGLSLMLNSCGKSRGADPGTEYMPDMYNSWAYEPMTQLEDKPNTINAKGMNVRNPAMNTIARGQLSYYYPYEKTPEGYEAAKKGLHMPDSLRNADKYIFKGKHLYDIDCQPCHGDQGLGDGAVSAKFPPNNIPSYATERIQKLEEGGMYHTITNGLNLMGSYASVLTPEERWCVIRYVEYLRDKAKATAPKEETAAPTDSLKK